MLSKFICLDNFFKVISYAVVFSSFFSLIVSGGISIFVAILFFVVFCSAWFLEKSRWQISEKLGTLSIFIVVPFFYVGWKYKLFGAAETGVFVVAVLAKMILILTAVKLLQKKADRDWLFLYLMSFFKVLLAAGLSISPLYFISLILYLLFTICAVIVFEIRKTSQLTKVYHSQRKSEEKRIDLTRFSILQLPTLAVILLFLIISLAAPLFFALPRVGSAGLGGNLTNLSNVSGFSNSVNLGEIGQLLQSDQIVMRTRIEKSNGKPFDLVKWRGIALNNFDNKKWTKSNTNFDEPPIKLEGDSFRFEYARDKDDLTIQTVYLEPIETPVLFTIAQPIAIQGNFQFLRKDSEGAVTFQHNDSDRLSYKVYSDTTTPGLEALKSDNELYSPADSRYLQLPEKMDERIAVLAGQITEKSLNRYDKAKAIENYLQTQFGYSLEMKAKGDEPLADFLFNVREGHCEYFATAMAVMLRSQGIATRVVNGFQQGEYNEMADIFVIRQKDAHSWVEVLFPGEKAWIQFDPTPFAESDGNASSIGILKRANYYIEALETFWIQYFVAYDNQEQRSLMRSVKNSFADYQALTSAWLDSFQAKIIVWWKEVRGDKGLQTSAEAVAFGISYLLAASLGVIFLVWFYRKIKKLSFWQKIYFWVKDKNEKNIVEFYERMQKVLAMRGFTRAPHQTPLEFAFALKMQEAVNITEKYNRVRFGEKNLSDEEAREIEDWLKSLGEKE
jgi:transglutaminase-like putative cysteine protease